MLLVRRVTRCLLGILSAATVSACSGAGETSGAQRAGSAQDITVQVDPMEATVAPEGTVAFAAAVTGTAETSVRWEVVEQGGGSVTGAGVYTAPAASGTFRVRVTSAVDDTKSAVATVTVTPRPPVTVSVAPGTASLAAGGTIAFVATVTNAGSTTVTWSLREASGCGSITAAGVYTAPASSATCHVVATSVADPTASATATVSVASLPPPTPVAVAVTPSSGTVDECRSLTFTAQVTGTTDTAVTWGVQEGAAGGTITAAGVYTAPAEAGTYHAVAVSRADPTKTFIVPITVRTNVLGVAISPQQITVPAGGTAQFTATVTTTCGTFSSTQTVNEKGLIVQN